MPPRTLHRMPHLLSGGYGAIGTVSRGPRPMLAHAEPSAEKTLLQATLGAPRSRRTSLGGPENRPLTNCPRHEPSAPKIPMRPLLGSRMASESAPIHAAEYGVANS